MSTRLGAPMWNWFRMNGSATRTASTTLIYPARSWSLSRSSAYRAVPNSASCSRTVPEISVQRRFHVGLHAFRLIGRGISLDRHTVPANQKLRKIPFDSFEPQYARERLFQV